jgi:hypothetical protein
VPVRCGTEIHQFEDLVYPFQWRIRGVRQNPDMVSPASPRMERVRLDAGAHHSGGVMERIRLDAGAHRSGGVGKLSIGETAEGGLTAGWRGQAKQDLHSCGLTRTVRAEKTRHASGRDSE